MGENGDDGDLVTIGIKWNDISCGKDFHVEAFKAEIDPDLGGGGGLALHMSSPTAAMAQSRTWALMACSETP